MLEAAIFRYSLDKRAVIYSAQTWTEGPSSDIVCRWWKLGWFIAYMVSVPPEWGPADELHHKQQALVKAEQKWQF